MNIRDLLKSLDPYRASVWLIAAYLIHLAEEWLYGFPEWSRVIRGAGVSSERFIVINAIALALFVGLTVIARRRPGMAWFPSILAAIFVINAVLHALATWRYGAYSPGTVSGLLIYVPLGIVVLREMRSYLSMNAFVACLGAGAIAHVFITFIAFR